jgi:cytochrome P450
VSAYFIHMDPSIFPEPHTFNPERWASPDARQKLDRYLFSFSRGPRSCQGINLAYAELYSVIATIFRRFPTMELHNTTWRDVELVHDYFAGMSRHGEGLQVKIRKPDGSESSPAEISKL